MAVTRRMRITLHPDEAVIQEGPANLQRGIENVGGRLFLTSSRLHFSAHAVNVQTRPADVPLGEVACVEVGRTRVFGIPLAPNAIEVHTRDGALLRFTVYRRELWKAAIEAACPAA